MSFEKFKVAASWWNSMNSADQDLIINSWIQANVIQSKENIIVESSRDIPKFTRNSDNMELKVEIMNAACLNRCEGAAAAVEDNCNEKGLMDPGDCLDLALDAWECCAERCQKKHDPV